MRYELFWSAHLMHIWLKMLVFMHCAWSLQIYFNFDSYLNMWDTKLGAFQCDRKDRFWAVQSINQSCHLIQLYVFFMFSYFNRIGMTAIFNCARCISAFPPLWCRLVGSTVIFLAPRSYCFVLIASFRWCFRFLCTRDSSHNHLDITSAEWNWNQRNRRIQLYSFCLSF